MDHGERGFKHYFDEIGTALKEMLESWLTEMVWHASGRKCVDHPLSIALTSSGPVGKPCATR